MATKIPENPFVRLSLIELCTSIQTENTLAPHGVTVRNPVFNLDLARSGLAARVLCMVV